MTRVTKDFEARREKVSLLLRAHVSHAKIKELTGLYVHDYEAEDEAGGGGSPQFKVDRGRPQRPQNHVGCESKYGGLHPNTVMAAMKKLGLASKTRPKRHLLTARQKNIRLERSKKILWRLKKGSTMFTVDQAFNRRNDRVVVPKDEEAPPVMTTKHPAGVMTARRCLHIFFPCGLKINTEEYLKVLRRVVLPWIKATYPARTLYGNRIAPPPTGRIRPKLAKNQHAKVLAKEVWPSSSPDLNPLDYAVWGELERHACATPPPSVEALKASILEAWANMSSNFVVKSCRIFRRRVEAVIKAECGHIKKNEPRYGTLKVINLKIKF
ncbi:Uncharacterized protein FKW44_000965 [Caligus rogercresseyi]|uniref:Uncharacterized protein n=1 Tax=Caligus rogercresseyi TaxID=217165 RepID=A0A7T8QVB4_CALRO|nr:Uncharacterized protein FKW44_000965 [Caligus rogercresseyi]